MPNTSRTPTGSLLTENLRSAFAESGMTQAMLAHLTGVSVRAVQKWLDGSSRPSTLKLIAAASALGRDPGWFYFDHSDSEKAA